MSIVVRNEKYNTINQWKRKIRWKSEAADSTERHSSLSHSSVRPSHLILVQPPIFNGRSKYPVVELSPHLNPPSFPPSSSSFTALSLFLSSCFLSLSPPPPPLLVSVVFISLEKALTMLEAKSWKLKRRKTRCF